MTVSLEGLLGETARDEEQLDRLGGEAMSFVESKPYEVAA
jgi:hypothetical protein